MKVALLLLASLALVGCGSTFQPRTPQSLTVVFIGDSITFNWHLDQQFPDRAHYINKGIFGQKAPVIAARFQADAIALHPDIIVVLAGTNDVLFHDPLSQPEAAMQQMVVMAEAAKIPLVICTMPPVDADIQGLIYDPQTVRDYNTFLKSLAAQHGYSTADYWSVLAGSDGLPKAGMLVDGVHPNATAYDLMAPLVKQVLN